MAALAGAGPGAIVFDVHSHTNVSHDVRGTLMGGFDTEANLRWHRRAGFDAVFVTDHNTVAGLRPHTGAPARCPGIEVSAWRAHVVLLGDSVPVDPRRYNGSLEALELLLRESRLGVRRPQRALAPRVRAESPGAARHARRGGRGRIRDRERRAQGERDLPGPTRFGRGARAPDEPVRAWARATVTAGAPPAWCGTSCP